MEESWVLLRKERLMSCSPPPPWWDRECELQRWRDGSGSNAEMQLLLPPCQQMGQIPSRSCFWCTVTTLGCGKVAGEGLLWEAAARKMSSLRVPVAEGSRG